MATRMLEVDSECQALFEAFERLLAQVRARRSSASGDSAAVDYGQVEQQLADAGAALEREAHTAVLAALDVQVPQLLVDGDDPDREMEVMDSTDRLIRSIQYMRDEYKRPVPKDEEIDVFTRMMPCTCPCICN